MSRASPRQQTCAGRDWGPRSGLTNPHSLPFSSPGCENPKPSLTELVVLEYGLYAGDPVSKVLLQPLTGMSRSRGQEAPQATHCRPCPAPGVVGA